MNVIEHKDIQYPLRTLKVLIEDKVEILNISVDSLQDKLDLDEPSDSALDESIYFYVPDDKINLPAEELSEKLLDTPFKLIAELQ